MSSGSERRASDESVFERNLRALLTRCYQPAKADPAFRARARAACLAAVLPSARGAPDVRVAGADRRSARGERRQLPGWTRAAAALAALLLVAVPATLWWISEARGDGRRDAILARGEVAARCGPSERWQAFGADESDGPDDRDVAHAVLASGSLQVVTPAGLGLDVELPDLPAATGACIDPASRVRLERTTGLEAELEQGGLSLTCANSGPAWTLATPQGALELTDGSLTARVIGAEGGGPAGAVWLLLDGSAALRGASGARSLPSGRAVSLRLGAITAYAADDDAHVAVHPGPGFVPPSVARPPEPLDAAELAGEPGSAATAALPTANLPAPRVLQGSVLSGGAPVTSFALVLVPQDVPPRAEVERLEVSAADGRFRWADVAPGNYVLFVLAPAAPAWKRSGVVVTASEPLQPLVVELDANGAMVSGFVTDRATGEPLAGAVVLSETDAPARLLPLDGSPMPELVTVLAVTDELGFFQLDRLTAGQQLLRATASGHAPDWSGPLTVQPGEHAEGLLFRLAPEARVRGHVLGADGLPSVGAILIGSPQPDTLRPCVSYSFAATGDDGSYMLGNQPAGAGIVILLGDDEARASGTPPRIQATSLSPGTDAVVDFTLAPAVAEAAALPSASVAAADAGCRLRGRVLGPDGAAAPSAMISLVREDAPAAKASEQWVGAMTAPDGSFDVPGLSPGTWELFIGDGDGTSLCRVCTVEVPAARELVLDVSLTGGSLAGQATSEESGQPVSRALLILMRRDEPSGQWSFHGRQLADASGRFRFEHLAAGRYEFTAHDMDGVLAASSSGDVLLTQDQDLDGLDVALRLGSALLVRVTDARGAPVADALVILTDAAGTSRQFAASPRTGAEGVLRSAGMPPGLWRVAVSAPPEAGLVPREVSVELRVGEAEELELVLPDAR